MNGYWHNYWQIVSGVVAGLTRKPDWLLQGQNTLVNTTLLASSSALGAQQPRDDDSRLLPSHSLSANNQLQHITSTQQRKIFASRGIVQRSRKDNCP